MSPARLAPGLSRSLDTSSKASRIVTSGLRSSCDKVANHSSLHGPSSSCGLRRAVEWLLMSGDTTAAVQRYLDELADLRGEAPAEPIVRELLATAVDRLHLLCRTLLYRSYPRLARPPLSLQTEEMLSAV